MCSQDDAHFAPRAKGGVNTTLRNVASLLAPGIGKIMAQTMTTTPTTRRDDRSTDDVQKP